MAISQRGWTLGGVGAGVLLVGLTYFVGVGPELSHASSVKSQKASAQQDNSVLSAQIDSLRAQSKNLDSLTTQLSSDLVALPADDELAGFTREVNALAVADGLSIASLSVSAPTVATTSATATSTSTSAAGQLFQIPISIVVNGDSAKEIDFIGRLHATGSRAVLISTVQLAGSTANASHLATTTIALKIFVAPQSPAQQAALKKELSSS